MSDLIERLRGRANGFQRRHGGTDGLDYYSAQDAQREIEAADALAEREATIERLTREIDDLRKEISEEPSAV
jgi:hypothetical protein